MRHPEQKGPEEVQPGGEAFIAMKQIEAQGFMDTSRGVYLIEPELNFVSANRTKKLEAKRVICYETIIPSGLANVFLIIGLEPSFHHSMLTALRQQQFSVMPQLPMAVNFAPYRDVTHSYIGGDR